MNNAQESLQNTANVYRDDMIGKVYRHFKGTLYKVDDIAVHSESDELMVVYHKLGYLDQVWVRPLDMFLSPVDKEKYPDVTQVNRFEIYEADWKQYWPGPYTIDSYCHYIFDSNHHMVMDSICDPGVDNSKVHIENLFDTIFNDKPSKDDGMYSRTHDAIFRNNKPFMLIRGWGYLTGTGGLKLTPEEATFIQDCLGDYIVNKLNDKHHDNK